MIQSLTKCMTLGKLVDISRVSVFSSIKIAKYVSPGIFAKIRSNIAKHQAHNSLNKLYLLLLLMLIK